MYQSKFEFGCQSKYDAPRSTMIEMISVSHNQAIQIHRNLTHPHLEAPTTEKLIGNISFYKNYLHPASRGTLWPCDNSAATIYAGTYRYYRFCHFTGQELKLRV